MSSKFKVLNIALVAVLALGLFAATAKADVTGSFNIDVIVVPQTTALETSPLLIDFVNRLDITYVVSGLSTTFSSRFGVAGIEDALLTTSATLGALDLTSLVVFARFAFQTTDPFYDTLHFIKKRVTASISLGGVTFTNIATFEDVNAFGAIAGTSVAGYNGVDGPFDLGEQSPIYAFGDIINVSGQTPSGVGIEFETAFCMEDRDNLIKARLLASESVNEECVSYPKPDILFDYETISITGVPIAPGVVAEGTVECVQIIECEVVTSFTFNAPTVPIPFTATFAFENLTELDFSGADLIFNAGAGTLVVSIDETGLIAATNVTINATLNPDTNPATLLITAEIDPGTGIADTTGDGIAAVVQLAVTRLGFTTSATALFVDGAGGTAEFFGISFAVDVPGGLVDFSASSFFTLTGMSDTEFSLSVNF